MKKFFLFITLLLFFNVGYVEASKNVELVGVFNKCSVVKDNRVSIKVDVLSKEDGLLTSLIPEYTLGMIDNDRESMEVVLRDIKGNKIKYVLLDYNRDSDGRSYIKYKVSDDLEFKQLDTIMSFYIDVKFNDEIPETFEILGNKVVLSDSSLVCETINGYKVTEVEKNVYIENEKRNSVEECVIVGTVFVFLVILFIVIRKR